MIYPGGFVPPSVILSAAKNDSNPSVNVYGSATFVPSR